jgi:phosphoribosylglycinamide formyltransferase-1
MERKHLAIFASGKGTNAKKIISHFKNNAGAQVSLIVCNNPTAEIISIAAEKNIPVVLISKNDSAEKIISELKNHRIDFIVLAGYLWLIPAEVIKEFPNRIINIHPSLLPKYGGKGMYGMKVHEAVKASRENKTGITIHFVNEEFDSGEIIFQAEVMLNEFDSPQTIAQKVQQLEHEYFAREIEKIIFEV